MKQIEDYPGYWIDEFGNVLSFKGKEPKVLSKVPNSRGYLQVHLCKDGKPCLRYIHRLVAEAFIPNPLGLDEVNHKDEDKTNNRVENLEWCTREYNNNYGTRNEKVAKSLVNNPKRSKPVTAYIDGEYYGEYPSTKEAARQLGLYHTNITSCCKGNRKHTGGYEFRYKDAEACLGLLPV